LPERLAASEKRLETALAGIHRLTPAVDRFYATLTEEQKTEANRAIIFP
jgi:hypothetical protein